MNNTTTKAGPGERCLNGATRSSDTSQSPDAHGPKEGSRSRGRPRKDWSAIDLAPPILSNPPASLDADQAELLYQFILHTGPSFADQDNRDDPITRFWSHNAALIGCSHPAVLHLCLALAARHLTFLKTGLHRDNPKHYDSLAKGHFNAGLFALNEALRTVSPASSGAVYLSTVLFCYCTFAAGPSSPTDLLVCDISAAAPVRWLSVAKGTSLLRESFDNETLYVGLMSPLSPSNRSGNNTPSKEDSRPAYKCQDFPRLDWIQPLEELSSWITAHGACDSDVLLPSLCLLRNIYEATFGNDHGVYTGASRFKMVFIWLYLMEDSFVSILQKEDNHLALLLVAYYAPLLKTLKKNWYIHGWAEHIIRALELEIQGKYAHLMKWPLEAIYQLEQHNL